MDRVYGVSIFALSLMALGAICSATSMVRSWKSKGRRPSNPKGTLVSDHNAISFETNMRDSLWCHTIKMPAEITTSNVHTGLSYGQRSSH